MPAPSRRHRPRDLSRRLLLQAAVAALAAAAIGVVLGLTIDWFPRQGSAQADQIDTLFKVLVIVSVPIFVVVQAVVLFSVWRFRVRAGEENDDGPPIHGNTRLEVLWTAFPAILLISLCSYAYVVLRDFERKPAGRELDVNVTSQQFAWSFSYPRSVTGGQAVAANQLVLPQGRSVRFHIRSLDVLHAFWVPSFRLQIDAVPGQTTEVRATPNRVGDFPLVCAELCGLGHSAMRSTVHVVSPTAFARWLHARGAAAVPAAASSGQVAAAGRRVFTGSSGCGSCHTLSDAGTSARLGPNLDRSLRGRPATLIRRAILNPDARVLPGYGANVMPRNFGSTLSRSEVDALVAYLHKATTG